MRTCTLIDTPVGEVEFEYTYADWTDSVVEQCTNGNVVVGYLSHDEDCQNPLEDCDGMGKIHHHPSSRYGNRNSDYYEILGLDRYGDPIIDDEKLQMRWRDKVLALPLEVFSLGLLAEDMPEDYQEKLAFQLADEQAEDASVECHCKYAWRHNTKQGDVELDDEQIEVLFTQVEQVLDWNYDRECEACYEPGDPGAVLLDLYDHSGQVWSVSGDGMQCRWDTSRGESVWVPDKCAREEIERRAPVYNYAWIEHTTWLRGKGKSYLLHFGERDGVFSDDWSELWAKAQEIAAQGGEPRFDGRRRAAVEMAEDALESYNAWASGDCYGVVVQTHGMDGELINEDACWGYIGGDYAEEELASQVKWAVEHNVKEEAA